MAPKVGGVAPEGEKVIRYSAWLIGTYYSLVVFCILLSVALLMASIGMAIDNERWSKKIVGVLSWGATSLMFAVSSFQMYSFGRTYSQTYVAIGAAGLRMRLPRSDGDLLAIEGERRFEWNEISEITYEHSMRKRVCRFRAGKYIYTLTQNNCPSPGKVAQLLAEKKGVPLVSPEARA